MVGCHMYNASAAVGGNKVASQHRTRLGKEPTEMVHRVTDHCSRDLLAF